MTSISPNTDGQKAYNQVMRDDAWLSTLKQEDPDHYRHLHEQALHYLNEQLVAGNQALESAWTAVYERLGDLFVARDTAALLQMVVEAETLPLHSPPAQHSRQFFQGIAQLRQAHYAPALDTFSALLTDSKLNITLRARTLNAQAVVNRLTGKPEAALAGYTASLALWQELDDSHYQGIVTLNLGIISYSLRRYVQADTYLRQAEQFFEAAQSMDWLSKTQSELGLVQRDLGHWNEALAYLETYIARSEQQESWEDVGVGEINRGEVLLFKGEGDAAKTALQRALTLTVGRTYRIDPLLFLGLAHQAEGDLAQAERYYREALALATEIDRREILPHVYFYLGDVVRRQGQDEEALTFWQQAADVIEETHTPLRDEALKISLLGRWQQVYEALILHCAALGHIEEAFAWAERARARAFVEGLVAEHQEQPIISLPQLQATIPEATTLLCYFTTGVLEQDIPLLRAIPASNPLRNHILTPAKTLLFVITSTEIKLHECPLDPNLFATSSPRGFEATRFLKTAVLQHLSATLLPTQYAVRNTPHHLVIIPHGPLHRVPFTAVLAQTDNPPTLSFSPSGTIFATQKERGMATNYRAQTSEVGNDFSLLKTSEVSHKTAVSCLAVGYNGIRGSRYLKYADGEVEAVSDIMNGKAWLGSAPKKAQLRERASTCRWLHIACHGWFDDADPLASYLETGAGERLTAREVLETWSLQAELVVLSACETGISQILRGDEPMGLVRAFLYAGAQAVLVSQWPVDDLATFLLMGRLYEELQAESENLSVALAKAQAWLRGVTAVTIQQIVEGHGLLDVPNEWLPQSQPFAPPQFWAGFVLVGNL